MDIKEYVERNKWLGLEKQYTPDESVKYGIQVNIPTSWTYHSDKEYSKDDLIELIKLHKQQTNIICNTLLKNVKKLK